MRRHFRGEKPNFDDDDDDDDFEEDEEMVDIEVQNLHFVEYDIIKGEMKQKILQQAISFLQKSSFWWKFKKFKTKLKQIEETYNHFCNMTKVDDIGADNKKEE